MSYTLISVKIPVRSQFGRYDTRMTIFMVMGLILIFQLCLHPFLGQASFVFGLVFSCSSGSINLFITRANLVSEKKSKNTKCFCCEIIICFQSVRAIKGANFSRCASNLSSQFLLPVNDAFYGTFTSIQVSEIKRVRA